MKIDCLVPHTYPGSGLQFQAGVTYDFTGPAVELGRGLLYDFGPDSSYVRRINNGSGPNSPKFAVADQNKPATMLVVNAGPEGFQDVPDGYYAEADPDAPALSQASRGALHDAIRAGSPGPLADVGGPQPIPQRLGGETAPAPFPVHTGSTSDGGPNPRTGNHQSVSEPDLPTFTDEDQDEDELAAAEGEKGDVPASDDNPRSDFAELVPSREPQPPADNDHVEVGSTPFSQADVDANTETPASEPVVGDE